MRIYCKCADLGAFGILLLMMHWGRAMPGPFFAAEKIVLPGSETLPGSKAKENDASLNVVFGG